jgi:phage FluMu protein Com
MKPVAQCKTCNKTLTTEEVEVGTSLVCPRCDPKPTTKVMPDEADSRDSKESAEKEKGAASD